MNTETNLQSTAPLSDAAEIAEAEAAMSKLRARVADVRERFAAIRYDPNKQALIPALIEDAVELDAELKTVLAAYEKTR